MIEYVNICLHEIGSLIVVECNELHGIPAIYYQIVRFRMLNNLKIIYPDFFKNSSNFV